MWRRLLVPGTVRVDKLHAIFQRAMGWTDSHLHAFDIGGQRFGMDDEDAPEDEIDERRVSVVQAIGEGTRFEYEYDFGDGWDHTVVVEEVSHHQPALKFAVCLGGENACPPEDVGGSGGYADFVAAMADPAHSQHTFLSDWYGDSFDPSAFDLVAVNAELQRLR